MITNPFQLFAEFPELQVALFTKVEAPLEGKSDDVDAAVAKKLDAQRAVSAAQIHGNKTSIVNGNEKDFPDADALATTQTGTCLITRWADCQNFVIYAPKQKVIGIVHAGWRGLVKGVIEEHFKTLKKEWGIEPQDVFVGAGPSLCQNCAEFSDPENELPGIDPRFFRTRHVDLRGIAEEKLKNIGVLPNHFERLTDCPRCQAEQYWSYRAKPAEVKNGGRNLTVAVLRGM